jgi:protein involved in polysaccharide export with SLBB domain
MLDGWILRRPGQSPVTFDGATATMAVLQAGDTIEVPLVAERKYVAVTGAVNRPGSVAFRTGMKLTEAIVAAGGPAPDADFTRIEVRSLGGKKVRANLAAIRSGKQRDPVLKFGDAVIVPRGRVKAGA